MGYVCHVERLPCCSSSNFLRASRMLSLIAAVSVHNIVFRQAYFSLHAGLTYRRIVNDDKDVCVLRQFVQDGREVRKLHL